jgi:hypothetical protein
MFNPNPGMSHVDSNRLLPAVYAPMSKASSSPEPTQNPQLIGVGFGDSRRGALANVGKSANLTISSYHKDILYGTLLGDASLSSENGGRTYRLRLVQGKDHKDYFEHLVFQFEHFGKTPPKLNPDNNTYYWNSLQSGSFRFYGQEFYQQVEPNKFEKKVPDNVKRWLTPRAATYWFLDDGSPKDKKTTTAIRFCTDSFSRFDVERLAEGLETNFDVKTSIYENRPNQHRIYCKAPSVSSFWDKVLPILQTEIAPTAPEILKKLPNKIYNQLTFPYINSGNSNLSLD